MSSVKACDFELRSANFPWNWAIAQYSVVFMKENTAYYKNIMFKMVQMFKSCMQANFLLEIVCDPVQCCQISDLYT